MRHLRRPGVSQRNTGWLGRSEGRRRAAPWEGRIRKMSDEYGDSGAYDDGGRSSDRGVLPPQDLEAERSVLGLSLIHI